MVHVILRRFQKRLNLAHSDSISCEWRSSGTGPPPWYNTVMISRADILKRRAEIIALAARHGASHVRIFGSVARGDAGETSDLDLLVRFEPDRSLIDHGLLIEELQGMLHVTVDVVSEGALRKDDRFGHEVLREAVVL